MNLDALNPNNASTNFDYFYDKCKVPIVTTFHSAYTFREWMNLVVPLKKRESDSKLRTYAAMVSDYWKRLINYKSFNDLNKQKLVKSAAGIVFSNYLSRLIAGDGSTNGCNVIYHGSASAFPTPITEREARERLSLPRAITGDTTDNDVNNSDNKKIALALGFLTATKRLSY